MKSAEDWLRIDFDKITNHIALSPLEIEYLSNLFKAIQLDALKEGMRRGARMIDVDNGILTQAILIAAEKAEL